MMVWPRKPEVVVQGRLFSRGVLWGPPPLSHTGSVAGPDTGSRALEPPDSVFVSISPPVHGQDSGYPRPVNASWRGDPAKGKAAGQARVKRPRKGGLKSDLRVEQSTGP